jgi:hypothetical protein
MEDEQPLLIKYLIYTSRPVDFNPETLNSILVMSKRENAQRGITGALICRPDRYLQYLEGPTNQIDANYHKIRQDDRHIDIQLLAEGTRSTRLFSEWAMRDDPPQSWMWSSQEIAAGVLDRLKPHDALDIFIHHASEVNKTTTSHLNPGKQFS